MTIYIGVIMSVKSVANKIGYRNLPGYILGQAALKKGIPSGWVAYSRAANAIGKVADILKVCSYKHEMTRNFISKSLYTNVDLDEKTRTLITSINSNSWEYIPEHEFLDVTGLIDFHSGQIHLDVSCRHIELSEKLHLRRNKEQLIKGWYGFTLSLSKKEPNLDFSPRSGKFGRMPIEFAPIFENYMKEIFGGGGKPVLFDQLSYSRRVSTDTLHKIFSDPANAGKFTVERSLSDRDLLREFFKKV